MATMTAFYTNLDWRVGDEVFYILPNSDMQLPGVITAMGSMEVEHPTLGLVPVVIVDIKVMYPDQKHMHIQHRMEYPELAQSYPQSPPTRIRATKERGKRLVHQRYRRGGNVSGRVHAGR